MTGIDRIAKERVRQQEKLGWTNAPDAEHDDGSLAMAAVCYAAQAADERVYVRREYAAGLQFNDPWPWEEGSDARFYGADGERGNVLYDPPDDAFRIRLLEKAGALIAAEIDRLLKANRKSAKP